MRRSNGARAHALLRSIAYALTVAPCTKTHATARTRSHTRTHTRTLAPRPRPPRSVVFTFNVPERGTPMVPPLGDFDLMVQLRTVAGAAKL